MFSIKLAIYFAVCLRSSLQLQHPQVTVNEGQLRGIQKTTRGQRTFNAFEGIPFAKPPLGQLRFQPPVPIERWEGVKNATQPHSICPQRDIYRRSELIEGEEDCLYLNVYTPAQLPSDTVQSTKPPSLLPVMIFFHGGGWLCGGGNSHWYGPSIMLDRDVVLVVTNYRLGALGFISTGDEVAPGNNGLKDQVLAMQWVKDNIERFGGDPQAVTIFGESAGGASVQLHMMSPMSKGLFRAGISQSGTVHCPWALAPNAEQPKRHAKQLGEAFGCNTESSEELLECLRQIPAEEIVAKDKIFMKWDTDPMIPFKPVVEPEHDGAFLSKHPLEIMRSGKFNQVPWIIGLNTEDGALRAAGVCANPHLLEELEEDFNRVIPISLLYDETSPNVEEVTQKIRKFYFGQKKIDLSLRKEIVDLWTDGWFLKGADDAILAYLKYSKQPVYYYLFGHRGIASFTEIFGDKVNDYGVCHADDLQYLFPVGDGLFPDRPPTDDDKKVAEILTTLWSNFARTGNPTPDSSSQLLPVQWTPVSTSDSKNLEYLYIDSKSVELRKGLLSERTQFWRDLKLRDDLNEIRDEL